MFHVFFRQSGQPIADFVTDDLAEAQDWTDRQFATHVWGGAFIRYQGRIISERSRSKLT